MIAELLPKKNGKRLTTIWCKSYGIRTVYCGISTNCYWLSNCNYNLAEDTANKMEEILKEKGLVVKRYDTTETILIEYTQIVEAKMKVAE